MCAETGCDNPVKARGLCNKHYGRAWRRGEIQGDDPRGRHGNHARGDAHHRYNNGQLKSSHGYVLIRVPEGHHLRQANGYAYEHQLVAEETIGRPLEPCEIVHHRNGNTTDNQPENLQVTTRSEHIHIHIHSKSSGPRNEMNPYLDGEMWRQMPERVAL